MAESFAAGSAHKAAAQKMQKRSLMSFRVMGLEPEIEEGVIGIADQEED